MTRRGVSSQESKKIRINAENSLSEVREAQNDVNGLKGKVAATEEEIAREENTIDESTTAVAEVSDSRYTGVGRMDGTLAKLLSWWSMALNIGVSGTFCTQRFGYGSITGALIMDLWRFGTE